MEISDWRKKIDEIDRQIVDLINQRGHAAQEIGRLKRSSDLPIVEPNRERKIFENVCALNKGPLSDAEICSIYEKLIDAMRALQKEKILQPKGIETEAVTGPERFSGGGPPLFDQITVIGAGLIGGSLMLALKRHGLVRSVIGCDRVEVLSRALERGVIDRAEPDPVAACKGSELVVLAAPIRVIIEMLEKVGPTLAPETLITDVGSTKQEVAAHARRIFGEDWQKRFLPGHPMAGKELSGVEQADAGLYSGATWIFCLGDNIMPGTGTLSAAFVKAIHTIGASPVFLSPEKQDAICAWVSHMQQMTSTAMANALLDFADEAGSPELYAIGGRALREMTRISSSPYSMWRDIASTNSGNIEEAIQGLEKKLAEIRQSLKSPGLQGAFERANAFNPLWRAQGKKA